MKMAIPSSYDSLPQAVLIGCQKRIASLDFIEFRERFQNRIWPGLQKDFGVLTASPEFTLRRSNLLGAWGACLWIACAEPHWAYRHTPFGGGAMLLDEADQESTIPVLLTFGTPARSTCRHEKIHLCQLLHPDQSPVIAEDWDALAESLSDEACYTEPILRLICRIWWRELEAVYGASRGRIGDVDDFLLKVAGSVMAGHQFSFSSRHCASPEDEEFNKSVDRFFVDCASRFPWMGELMEKIPGGSFLNHIWELLDREATFEDIALEREEESFKKHQRYYAR